MQKNLQKMKGIAVSREAVAVNAYSLCQNF